MIKMSQRIGTAFYSVLYRNRISIDDAAERIGYSIRDINRLIEGKLYLSPKELERITGLFNTTPQELIMFKPDSSCPIPRLEYNKEFSSEDHLYQIVDLIDEYIELKEQL